MSLHEAEDASIEFNPGVQIVSPPSDQFEFRSATNCAA
jgi:hypothetical protein